MENKIDVGPTRAWWPHQLTGNLSRYHIGGHFSYKVFISSYAPTVVCVSMRSGFGGGAQHGSSLGTEGRRRGRRGGTLPHTLSVCYCNEIRLKN